MTDSSVEMCNFLLFFILRCNDGPLGGLITLNESGKLNGMLSEVGAV